MNDTHELPDGDGHWMREADDWKILVNGDFFTGWQCDMVITGLVERLPKNGWRHATAGEECERLREENEKLHDRISCLMGELSNDQPRQVAELAARFAKGGDPQTVIRDAIAEYKAHYNLSCEFREEDQRELRRVQAELTALRARLAEAEKERGAKRTGEWFASLPPNKHIVYADLIPQDSGYTVISSNLPGCITQGESIDECKDNLEDAALTLIHSYAGRGQPIPWKLPEPLPDASRTIAVVLTDGPMHTRREVELSSSPPVITYSGQELESGIERAVRSINQLASEELGRIFGMQADKKLAEIVRQVANERGRRSFSTSPPPGDSTTSEL